MEEEVFNPSLVININKNPQDAVIDNWYYFGSTESDIKRSRTAKLIEIKYKSDGSVEDFVFKLTDDDSEATYATDIYPLFLNDEYKLVKEPNKDLSISFTDRAARYFVGKYCYCYYNNSEEISGLFKINDLTENGFIVIGDDAFGKICPAFEVDENAIKKYAIDLEVDYIKRAFSKEECFELIKKIRKEIILVGEQNGR